jgi:two-component system CheB/CheR fusion protein
VHFYSRIVPEKNAEGEVETVLAIARDITERKKAEEELLKQYHVLRQSEEVAGIGSWEYDIDTGNFHWSQGMYRLFGLPQGSPVTPDIYLDHVIAAEVYQ